MGSVSILIPTQGAAEGPTAIIWTWFSCIVDIGEGGVALIESRDGVAKLI